MRDQHEGAVGAVRLAVGQWLVDDGKHPGAEFPRTLSHELLDPQTERGQ